jgi:hypothetical protein
MLTGHYSFISFDQVPISVDDIIARRKGKLHSGANGKKRKRDSEMEEESDSEDSEAEMSEIDGEDEVNSDGMSASFLK